MKILGIERDDSACNHYRILQPLMMLRKHGLADTLTIKEADIYHNPDNATQKVLDADIVVFQRPANEEWLHFVRLMRKHGKIMVADYDDDPFHTSPLSPAYKYYGTEEIMMQWSDGKTDMLWKDGENFNVERNIRHIDLFKANFRKADMVTSTNESLAETFRKINPNSIVLPNLIDFSLYPRLDCVKKNIRILWQGGSSHYEDIYMVSQSLVKILKKYKNVTFVYFGDTRFRALLSDAPKEQIEYQDWVGHTTYPYKLATLNCDIGLCPVVDNIFNRRKSSIKWMEYSTQGIATIASDIPPYNTDISHNITGLLVKDDGWFDAIKSLIENRRFRERLGRDAYAEVFENHNSDTKAYLWKDAYEKLLKKELVEA